ncbi:MAG: hypothetical protein ACOY3P_20855 [Planctomycetota bacterium]
MAKPVRRVIQILLAIVAVGALAAVLLWRGAAHVPAAYREALATSPETLAKHSDKMLQHSAELASDIQKKGQWEAAFTAEEINGWLAVDLPRNHPGLLPAEITDPRISIQPDAVVFYCRADRGGVSGVLSLEVEPQIVEPNVLGLRFRRLRAGSLPLPRRELVDRIADASAKADLPLQWKQLGGDPVAMLTLRPRAADPPSDNASEKRPAEPAEVVIDAVQLADGEIIIQGHTEPTAL